jgi:hypothetical protein
MAFWSFSYRKIMKFHKIKASTKLWKVQVVLPCCVAFYKKDENEKKSVWVIRQVLN